VGDALTLIVPTTPLPGHDGPLDVAHVPGRGYGHGIGARNGEIPGIARYARPLDRHESEPRHGIQLLPVVNAPLGTCTVLQF
jgi:hypothetical protein